VKKESAFHAGFVMQFSAMLCTHVMRVCRSVHKDLVNALCIKGAFDLVRKKMSSEEPGIVAAQEIVVEEKRALQLLRCVILSPCIFAVQFFPSCLFLHLLSRAVGIFSCPSSHNGC
jgi:hypothetical protein